MNIKNLFPLNILVLGAILFLTGGCSSQLKAEPAKNKQEKVDVVTVGIPKSQTKSFGEHYAQAVKFGDLETEGVNLNKKGLYKEAIEKLNQALSYADSRVHKAMAYDGLAVAYGGLGDIEKQIEYLEKEAKATLSENHRAELLKQIEALKSRSGQ